MSADRYTGEFFAAPSPGGQRVAFSARGNSSGQSWRKGHSHLEEETAGAAAALQSLTGLSSPRQRVKIAPKGFRIRIE